ncbi:flavin reductase domain protein FMN-binding protein [Thalassoporum mexicanum PCC 7367]|uniref:diflavin flavoprotein n=1 Tax=Thalassoporum mexicanum TaxID=3457544 RepID=UPI00029FD665|nr:diflavin flavoprotein [Pseudanabaena sp. PCC 7367]AFY71746.1 flavin reductase domain protein FMN-binding protein [Pseudanabaena sp. PCC 7367]
MPQNKPRDVQAAPIAEGILALRARSWNRLRFEIEYALERGTTANSFVLQGDRMAIIDPPGGTFTQIYLAALQSRIDIRRVDYVILGHVNPNRIETIKELLKLNPNITLVCTNPGAITLKEGFGKDENENGISPEPLKLQIMRGGEELDLGKGKVLQFYPTPTPRWPDGMCTYDRQAGILFTDKLFGCHTCSDQVFDEGWQVFSADRRYYFDCLMANQTRQVETALDKITPLATQFYAPGHGPMLRYGLHELVGSYRHWCETQKQQSILVTLLYASAYGNTATLGDAIARGINKAGIAVEIINCENAEPAEIKESIEKCAGFLIGSPTLGGHLPTQVQTALGIVLANAPKSCPAGVFGSYGWSGEAVDILTSKLQDAGYNMGFEPIKIKFKPTQATLQICEETGTDFAQNIKRAKKVKKTMSPTTTVEEAVGRIVGSLSVVTVKREEVSSAMLASWVSQATFNPPGLTVSVAKERAIESYMHQGDRFVLNILEEEKQLYRHFLKKFAPGEDRFVDVETEPAQNGSPILKDALAYLECKVEQRMECGDHWVVYAKVEDGKVLEPNGLTALHHRKSGSHY